MLTRDIVGVLIVSTNLAGIKLLQNVQPRQITGAIATRCFFLTSALLGNNHFPESEVDPGRGDLF